MTDYKLVPIPPTPEMVEAAEDAYMPFGDMDLAIRMAVLAAPAVQGEPTDDELLNWAAEEQLFLLCEEDDFLQIAREVLHKYRSRSPAVQGGPVADGFREIVEAVSHIGVDFGYGNFDLSHEHIEKARALLEATPQPAEQQPAPDVVGLVDALEQCITSMLDSGYRADAVVIRAARSAIAAHSKGDE